MSIATRLITVAEYDSIPEPPGGRYELHHGELVFMSFAKKQHARVQRSVFAALFARCGDYYVGMEFACRPLPEYELWAVDVGATANERWEATSDDDWLAGSPELVIEVLSPSNTKREMDDRRDILFTGGCRQFWTVDYKTRSVTVATPGNPDRTYTGSDSIPLEPFASQPLPLAEIFAEIE